MSVAGAIRHKMTNGYAHLGNSLRRPTVAGKKFRSTGDSIAAERAKAIREANAKKKKK